MRTTPSPLTRLVSTEASSGIQSIRKTFFGSNALKLIDPPDLTKDVDDYGSPKAPTLGLNTTTISPFSVSALPEKLQFSPAAMYRIIDPRGLTQVPESLLLVEGFSRYVLMKQRFFNLTKNIHLDKEQSLMFKTKYYQEVNRNLWPKRKALQDPL